MWIFWWRVDVDGCPLNRRFYFRSKRFKNFNQVEDIEYVYGKLQINIMIELIILQYSQLVSIIYHTGEEHRMML